MVNEPTTPAPPIDDSLGERISDPRRVRALAHPVRLDLMDALGDGELTATECAEITGETVANCSYHLRTLAKYGYIVAGTRRGREKPWQLVSRSRDIRPDLDDPTSVAAVRVMAELALDRSVDHAKAWFAEMTNEDPEWIDSSTITTTSTWATVEEFAAISSVLQHITEHLRGRNDDPTLRPAGARPIQVLGVAAVDVAHETREARRT
jgi:DNA-binding transcriptional ArsR family regulator